MNIEDVKDQYAIFAAMYTIVYEEDRDWFIVYYDEDQELTYTENCGATCKISMDNDYGSDTENKKINMMWIEDIKKHYNWKQGDVILLNMKQNCDGCFYVVRGWRDKDDEVRVESKNHYDVGIDEDGFVVKRYFQHYTRNTTSLIPSMDYVIRPACVYNDFMVS